MRILTITPRPDIPAVEPLVMLDVVTVFQRGQQALLDLTVKVRTQDNKLLGIARPTGFSNQQLSLAANGESMGEAQVSLQVVLSLSPKQVDYLEGLRSQHRKGDVVLPCEIEAQFLVSKTVNAHLHVTEERASPGGNAVTYRNHSGRDLFAPRYADMWVLSGDNGRVFMETHTIQHQQTVTIGSGDWLHDYAARWGGTRYVVVELPQPEILVSPVTPNITQRVNTAIEAAKRAAENVTKGEWSDVIEDLRPVWELIRNDADIASLLQRDGYPQDAIAAFNESIKQQFTFASKFMHRLDQGQQIRPEIRASKEDAWLCYTFAMAVLNLVTRKATRLG